ALTESNSARLVTYSDKQRAAFRRQPAFCANRGRNAHKLELIAQRTNARCCERWKIGRLEPHCALATLFAHDDVERVANSCIDHARRPIERVANRSSRNFQHRHTGTQSSLICG